MLEFFERAYYHEFERKDNIINGTNLPITVIAALYGSIFYISDSFISTIDEIGFKEFLFIAFALPGAFLIFVSSYYFARVRHSVEYEYLNEPNSLKEYFDGLVKFYQQSGKGPNSTYLAKQEFEEYINKNYTKCATTNYNSNIVKSYFKYKGQIALFYSIPFVFVCAIFLLWDKVDDKGLLGNNNVEYEATMEQEMTDNDKKPAEQETTPVIPEKPVEPPTRLIKEDTDPRKVKNGD